MKFELEKDEAVQIIPIEYAREECAIDVIREMMPLAEIMAGQEECLYCRVYLWEVI